MTDSENLINKIKIEVEIVEIEPDNPDLANTTDFAEDSFNSLVKAGYQVEPAYKGTRGGNFFDIFQEVAKNAHDNKEILTALFQCAAPIVGLLVAEQKKRLGLGSADPPLPKSKIEIDKAELEADGSEKPEELAERFTKTHPKVSANVTHNSEVKVKVPAPKRSKNRRR